MKTLANRLAEKAIELKRKGENKKAAVYWAAAINATFTKH